VIRFCVTLLIEPQINPLKHFPVVTVSHKLIFGFTPVLAGLLETHLGFGPVKANTIAGAIIVCIPGIFGFLVWELKENWRIFAANRRETLHPVMIGRKGETMTRLLRPGFHSGTVPKLYARLRRTDRKAYATGQWTAPRKYRQKLAQVRQAILNFIDRELLALLNLSGRWRPGQLAIRQVHVGLSQISIELVHQGDADANISLADESLRLEFEEQSGWLVARLTRPDWLDRLSPEQAHSLSAALAGLYKMSGVDLVREQIETALGPINGTYQVIDVGLRVWPEADLREFADYDLQGKDVLLVPTGSPVALSKVHPLLRERILFAQREIAWSQWVATWDNGAVATMLPLNIVPLGRAEATTG
jgi:hypothetical protein